MSDDNETTTVEVQQTGTSKGGTPIYESADGETVSGLYVNSAVFPDEPFEYATLTFGDEGLTVTLDNETAGGKGKYSDERGGAGVKVVYLGPEFAEDGDYPESVSISIAESDGDDFEAQVEEAIEEASGDLLA